MITQKARFKLDALTARLRGKFSAGRMAPGIPARIYIARQVQDSMSTSLCLGRCYARPVYVGESVPPRY